MVDKAELKTVAILLPSLKFGGAERVALNLGKALSDLGFEVEFLLMSNEGEFLPEALARFSVIDLKCDRTWKLPGRLFAHFKGRRSASLISSFWKLNLCACFVKLLKPRLKILLWEHGMISRGSKAQVALFALSASITYRFSHRIVCVSNGVREDIERLTVGLKRKLIVIFNPIQPPSANVINLIDAQGDSNRVLWVGRMTPMKNPGLLIDAFLLAEGRCKFSVHFIGDGPERGVLEARVMNLGMAERIFFEGFQANPYQWMRQSKLLVLSSWSEGFGNVLVEGMYCGLRVVSTDCGLGVHDVIAGRYGTIVPVDDAAAMADAICHELEAPSDPSLQAAAAQRFLPSVIANQFAAVL
jgi:glycosyltransferase involved in cell wall biosynthesis